MCVDNVVTRDSRDPNPSFSLNTVIWGLLTGNDTVEHNCCKLVRTDCISLK